MNPAGALMAAIAPSWGKMRFSNSGRRCEAQRHVVWTTVLARRGPRGVERVIQPVGERSETHVTGVWAWRAREVFSRRMRRRAWMNL